MNKREKGNYGKKKIHYASNHEAENCSVSEKKTLGSYIMSGN